MSRSVEFFERQFQRQARANEFELNPFERLALDYIHGAVPDLGCGLGNLARGVALRLHRDGNRRKPSSAVVRIRATAREEHHAVEAIEIDLAEFQIAQDYDRNVNWLANVLRRTAARAPLRDIQDRIRLGGLAVVNTTCMDMFTPGEYHLLRREELIHRFADWVVEVTRYDDFRAPLDTVKVFATVIKRKPEGGSWRRGSRGAMELSLRGSL